MNLELNEQQVEMLKDILLDFQAMEDRAETYKAIAEIIINKLEQSNG